MGFNRPHTIILTAAHTVYDPADSSTYYYGLLGGSAPSAADIYVIPIPVKGVIRTAVLRMIIGTVGTNENTTISIRKNATTDYTILTTTYEVSPKTFTGSGLNIPVDVGDFISIKIATPAFGTNPLQVREVVSVVLEC